LQSLQDAPTLTPEAFLAYVREVGQALAEAQPTMAAVSNSVGAVVLAAVEKGLVGSPDAMRQAAVARARQIVDSWDHIAPRIVLHAEAALPAGTILTHSSSATTLAVLEHLGQKGVPVIATESAPLHEGRTTVRLLARLGVKVTMIADAQAAAFMGEASAVLVGADTVFADGAVVNKVGTHALALLAHEARVPFYVATETLKISSIRPKPKLLRPAAEPPPRGEPQRALPAVYFDLTPARLVTAIITEEGVFSPSEIGPLARRARSYRKALFP
jgi:translation initiation factor 2B subunit (eIF-2B alpha/beta/delta family)